MLIPWLWARQPQTPFTPKRDFTRYQSTSYNPKLTYSRWVMINQKIQNQRSTSMIPNLRQSPYYLCGFDNPGNIICPVTVTGDNYANWSRLVTIALKSKNTLVFVDGSQTKPEINSPRRTCLREM